MSLGLVETYRRVDRRVMAVLAPWIFVLVPGIAIHELAHALVGRRYGDVDVEWTRPRVRMDWADRVPVWGIFGFFLAPLPVGGLVAFALPVVLPAVPVAADIWLVLNWVLLAGPSVLDVRELVLVLAGAE
jgi:hypothetical protein